MFLQLAHKRRDLYLLSKNILCGCYELTRDISSEDKDLIAAQIRKAGVIVHRNLTEALFLKKKRRKRARKRFQTALQGLILIDSGLEIVIGLGWATPQEISTLEDEVQKAFRLVVKLQKK
jgi:four helix bundle protein